MTIEKTRVKQPRAQKIITESPESVTDQGSFLALLPLKNVVILPKSVLPIIVGRSSSIQAIEYALSMDKMIFITAQKDSRVEVPSAQDLFEYGTRATILQVMRMPNGSLKILAEGICRARILSSHKELGFLGVNYEDYPTTNLELTAQIEALWRQLKSTYY